MTDRARELLERALEAIEHGIDFNRGRTLKTEIREFLESEESEKREPISEGEIYREMPMNCSGQYYDAFCDGVRFAEKFHGIQGEE